ncbi:cytochrome c3 family protein [Geotalea sp. SG265]|uniref:cytochrome c3 family protein n=1 Tax=Geotalea sp. SG265 TaxID=2922867 RepID=UPI001FAF8750
MRTSNCWKIMLAVLSLLICLQSTGCSEITRHEVMSTIFDGVPSYPPPEQFCREYLEKAELAQNGEKPAADTKKLMSRHAPYEEKKCDDCHDKTKENGLVVGKSQLCSMCHDDFIKGSFVHGPVAVGECLACHEPHTSQYQSLLKTNKDQACSVCHQEKRLSAAMHDKVSQRKVNCVDCHNPHYGNSLYFID